MNLFESIFKNQQITAITFFITLIIAIIDGIVFSFMSYYKSTSTKSFHITTAMIPSAVAMIIMLVNGNIGIGVAVAGAFGLVRFRSAQGNAREITIIFIAMASGLAFGVGYVFYGFLFTLLSGILLMIFQVFPIWEKKVNNKDKMLRIVIPENLDYNEVFDDLLTKYTTKHELIKVKSTNMGSLFQLTYLITLKDIKEEKEFIDNLRCRNGNLEILLERMELEANEL